MSILNPGGDWFWHPGLAHWNASTIWRHYLQTVGRGMNLILNIPPDVTGQIPSAFVQVCMSVVCIGGGRVFVRSAPCCLQGVGIG